MGSSGLSWRCDAGGVCGPLNTCGAGDGASLAVYSTRRFFVCRCDGVGPSRNSERSIGTHHDRYLQRHGRRWVGAGSVFFGLGLDAWGLSLGFPDDVAATRAGALVPIAVLTPDLLFSPTAARPLWNALLWCRYAVRLRRYVRDSACAARRRREAGRSTNLRRALVILLAGVLSACSLRLLFRRAFNRRAASRHGKRRAECGVL